ncbi:MAG: Rrf2 family transcriptional regulator [Arcobacteraceae bacterium]|nr:Rrf2 family transcriptional regulator [Arcobacteraceae bacterium]
MKLNRTSQYAIRIMTFIIQNKTDKLFNAKKISETLEIPYKYMTKIMTQLVGANIITSVRGRDGGYALTKEPSMIKIVDILEAVKEYLHEDICVLGTGACDVNKKCALHDRWTVPKQSIIDMFQNTTLIDLEFSNSYNLTNERDTN